MSILRDTLSLLATSLFSIPIGLATSIVLARFLGAHEMGLYSVLVNFATIALLLTQLGWPSATIYRHRRLGVPPATVATSAMLAMTASSLVCIGALWTLREPILSRLSEDLPESAYLFILALIPAQLFGRALVGLARALDRFDLANWYQVTHTVLTLLFLIASVVTFESNGIRLGAALASITAANLVASISLAIAILSVSGLSRIALVSDLRESIRYGSKSYMQTLAGQVHEQIDILMLAALLVDPQQIGCYAVAVGIANRLKVIPDAISNALFPHAAGLTQEAGAEVTARAARNAAFWVTACAVGAGLVGPAFIDIAYGQPFADATLPLLLLLPAGIAITIFRVLSRYFMAVNRQSINIATQAAAALTNVSLNLWLIPTHGILGAAASTIATYGLEFVLITLIFVRSTELSLQTVLIPSITDLNDYRLRITALIHRTIQR